MSDQERISPYSIKQTIDENREKNINWGLITDLI